MENGNLLDQLAVTDDVGRQRLMTLIATCEEMLLLANRGEWGRVAELESRRGKELMDYFSMPCLEPIKKGQLDVKFKHQDEGIIGEVIAMLIKMNERLVDIVTEARLKAGCEVHEIQHGQRAIAEYKSI